MPERRSRGVTLVFLACLCVAWVGQGIATETAEVLPKGVFRTELESNFYWPIDTKFGPGGKEENVAADFNQVLNGNVFQGLQFFDNLIGLPPGTSNIGTSVVDFQYEFTDLIFKLQYGVTEKLSVGIKVPYYWSRTNVKRLELDTTNANIGKNAFLGSLAPLGIVPGTVPLTTQDVQDILGPGLDINGDGVVDVPGFGYKPVQSWSGSGFSDIEAGFRYQYFKNTDWRLAFTGAVRFPTGKVDDPDDLMDVGFGTGAYALLFRLNNDFTMVKDLLLDLTLKYDYYLPQHIVLRVPDSPNQVITQNKENVSRTIGSAFIVDVSAFYDIEKYFSLVGEFVYGTKAKNQVSGSMGFNYSSLEEETDWSYYKYKAGVSLTTVPLYTEKKFPVPMDFSIGYENVFKGTNFLKQQYINMVLAFYF